MKFFILALLIIAVIVAVVVLVRMRKAKAAEVRPDTRPVWSLPETTYVFPSKAKLNTRPTSRRSVSQDHSYTSVFGETHSTYDGPDLDLNYASTYEAPSSTDCSTSTVDESQNTSTYEAPSSTDCSTTDTTSYGSSDY